MREMMMIHEHPLPPPGRLLHVKMPEFTDFIRDGPEFVRPGLLGVGPRRPVRYPLHPRPHPNVRLMPQEHARVLEHARAVEHARALEHVHALQCAHALEHMRASEHRHAPEALPMRASCAENFVQMAWLKGIQNEKKQGHIRNLSPKKFFNVVKSKNSRKVTKKGRSRLEARKNPLKEQFNAVAKHQVQEYGGTSVEVDQILVKDQSKCEREPKEQQVKGDSPIGQLSYETTQINAQMSGNILIEEELEEGEIGAESPVHYEISKADGNLVNANVVLGGDVLDSNTSEGVDNAERDIGYGSSEQEGFWEDSQLLENTRYLSERESASSTKSVSDTVELVGHKILGSPSVDIRATPIKCKLSADLHSLPSAHAKLDCESSFTDVEEHCLDNENLPTMVQETLVSSNLESGIPEESKDDSPCLDNGALPAKHEALVSSKTEAAKFENPKVDTGCCIKTLTMPEEEGNGAVMSTTSSNNCTACESLDGICLNCNLQRSVETCSKEYRENPLQTCRSLSGPKVQGESLACIAKEQILTALRLLLPENMSLALAEKLSSTVIGGGSNVQALVPCLSEIYGSLESYEEGNGCSKIRVPMINSQPLHFPELESSHQDANLVKESVLGKRQCESQEDIEEIDSKRLCPSREQACEPPADELHPEVLYQEPVDMEIDESDPADCALGETCSETTSKSNDREEVGMSHTMHSGSEQSPLMDSAKPKLRMRDPRKVLLAGEEAKTDSLCSGEMRDESVTTACVPECEGISSTSFMGLCKGATPWKNIRFEGLTDEELKAVYVERARRIDEQSRMLISKKLCLVLDLDHTLLNSAKFSEVDSFKGVLSEMEAADRRSISNKLAKRDLYRYPKLGMWTKLRPGVRDFLSRASQLFELHVYTMGNKAYATEMAKVLDPTGTLFAGRIISRGDDNDKTFDGDALPKSKDLEGVLGLESAVIIIDDSAHVWPHHRHNLLVVERYMYFPSSRRQFGLSGPSLLEIKHDERAADGMLASVLKVIEKIHQSFFSNQRLHEVDVRSLLKAEKRTILAGCKIVFSRVFPRGESQPHLHPLWQKAEQFGAVCTTNMDDGVTHVVAISLGTDKVKWAMRTGRFSVCPAWLEASAALYRRANESDFPVPAVG